MKDAARLLTSDLGLRTSDTGKRMEILVTGGAGYIGRVIVEAPVGPGHREPGRVPITEDFPLQPTNVYGETKLVFERALEWYDRLHALRWIALRYFNAAGATERLGEDHDPESHLIPIVLQVPLGKRDHVPL